MAKHDGDAEFKARFSKLAEDLLANEATIVNELNSIQGGPVDMGGYYKPDAVKVSAAMRPSATLNRILDAF